MVKTQFPRQQLIFSICNVLVASYQTLSTKVVAETELKAAFLLLLQIISVPLFH